MPPSTPWLMTLQWCKNHCDSAERDMRFSCLRLDATEEHIKHTWFWVKRDEHGWVQRHRTRPVAQGFRRTAVVKCTDTYAQLPIPVQFEYFLVCRIEHSWGIVVKPEKLEKERLCSNFELLRASHINYDSNVMDCRRKLSASSLDKISAQFVVLPIMVCRIIISSLTWPYLMLLSYYTHEDWALFRQ